MDSRWWKRKREKETKQKRERNKTKIIFLISIPLPFFLSPSLSPSSFPPQRMTTQLLFISSLRDASLFLRNIIVSSSLFSSSSSSSSPPPSSLLSLCDEIITNLNTYLITDAQKGHDFFQSRSTTAGNNTNKTFQNYFKMGEKLDFASLLPSFCDRTPFFDLIFANYITFLQEKEKKEETKGGEGEEKEEGREEGLGERLGRERGVEFLEEVKGTFMGKAKIFFDKKVLEHIISSSCPSSPSPPSSPSLFSEITNALSNIQLLEKKCLEYLELQRVNILTPINFAQVSFLSSPLLFPFFSIFFFNFFFFFFQQNIGVFMVSRKITFFCGISSLEPEPRFLFLFPLFPSFSFYLSC